MIRCTAVIILFVMSRPMLVHAEEVYRTVGDAQKSSVSVILNGIEPYDGIEPFGNETYGNEKLASKFELPNPVEPFTEPLDELFGQDSLRRFWGQVTGGVWLGALDGHLQTPAGGQLGTTSSHRPRVEEIGLDGGEWMPFLDARFVSNEKHEFHFSYIGIDRDGSDVLGTSLISQAQTFPAGSAVQSSMGLDTFRFGYRPHYWQWCFYGWKLTPEIGMGVARFEYQLRSPSATGPVDRSYNVGFPYLGILLEKPFGERFQFELDFAASGGINGVSFVDSDLRLIYDFYCGERWSSSAVLGWRGMWFRRHDAQVEEQNDPNLRFGRFSDDPLTGLTLGLRIGF